MRLIINFLWIFSMMSAGLFWLHWLPSVLSHELVGYVLFSKKSRPWGQILQSHWWFVLSKFILHAVLCGKIIGRSLGVSECYSARCTGLGEKEGFWQILYTCMKNEEVTNITLLELYILFDYLFEHVWNPFGFSFGRVWCFQRCKIFVQTQQKATKCRQAVAADLFGAWKTQAGIYILVWIWSCGSCILNEHQFRR